MCARPHMLWCLRCIVHLYMLMSSYADFILHRGKMNPKELFKKLAETRNEKTRREPTRKDMELNETTRNKPHRVHMDLIQNPYRNHNEFYNNPYCANLEPI